MVLTHPWPDLEDLDAAFGTRTMPPPAETVLVRQIHGTEVVVCNELAPGEHTDVRADALVATRPGRVVAVKTADCVPILLVAPRERGCWSAAVHAGWRGTAAGVIASAVADAVRRGVEAASLRACVGPAIGPCCYEVGEEVAATFRRLLLRVEERSPKAHVDLPASAGELLLRAGLKAHNVSFQTQCTRCNEALYHSYRRSGERSGRQLSWVGWRP